jgi:hypothetical protein
MSGCMQKPCSSCPWVRTKGGIRLTRGRVRELVANALSPSGGGFPCHKTVDYSDDSDGRTTEKSKECAGQLIFQDKQGRFNQSARILGRIYRIDFSKLDGRDDVFDSEAEMLKTAIR